ncbi:MAG: hypothetical protein J6Q73_05825, partial [Bacteroidaceae bacterium]|nr:hypothetical protein [Bacteroidaceae bacterium]
SDYVEVVLLQTETGIDGTLAADTFVEVYSIAGVKVYSGDWSGVPVLSKGVYVVVTANGARKIVIE